MKIILGVLCWLLGMNLAVYAMNLTDLLLPGLPSVLISAFWLTHPDLTNTATRLTLTCVRIADVLLTPKGRRRQPVPARHRIQTFIFIWIAISGSTVLVGQVKATAFFVVEDHVFHTANWNR